MLLISILTHVYYIHVCSYIYIIIFEETISVSIWFNPCHFLKGGKPSYFWHTTVWIVSPCPFVVQLFLLVFPCQNLKESVNEDNINGINQGSINAVNLIYHQSPRPFPNPITTEIKNNHIFSDIDSSYGNICNNINRNNCAKEVNSTVPKMTILNIIIIISSKNIRSINIDDNENNKNNNNSRNSNINNSSDNNNTNKNITLYQSVDISSLSSISHSRRSTIISASSLSKVQKLH